MKKLSKKSITKPKTSVPYRLYKRKELANFIKADQIKSWKKLFIYGRRQAKKLGITSEDQVNKIVEDYRQDK